MPEQEDNSTTALSTKPPDPVAFVPYPKTKDAQSPCYVDNDNTIRPPTISAYPGLPQHLTAPAMGSYEEVGINDTVCFDRIGRLGSYGWGYELNEGGLGIGMEGDTDRSREAKKIDYRGIKWRKVQERCLELNKEWQRPRSAFIIRTWHDYDYTPQVVMTLRALISELALGSGGEYTVHFLIHVRDESLPIWASEETYNATLRRSLPPEFEGMGTLWSVPQMRSIYPPFPESFENMSGKDLYGAYRSLHFAFQYFASRHTYDYYWHWEMDTRLTGHYYELLDRVTKWADRQPRKYLWERSSRFYIPALHNDSYATFSKSVARSTDASGQHSISGPQRSNLLPIPPFSPDSEQTSEAESHVTDLITFDPIFDPNNTAWIFNADVTGWNISEPRPPRRASLVTISRLSARLLALMHTETYQNRHTMFSEMFPASIALHYGLKAVYVPLPVHFDRLWSPEQLDKTFNAGPDGSSGGGPRTVFGPLEHAFRGSTYYSNAGFAGALWRRWLGRAENGEGGPESELESGSEGRMCLRSMLLHPVKNE